MEGLRSNLWIMSEKMELRGPLTRGVCGFLCCCRIQAVSLKLTSFVISCRRNSKVRMSSRSLITDVPKQASHLFSSRNCLPAADLALCLQHVSCLEGVFIEWFEAHNSDVFPLHFLLLLNFGFCTRLSVMEERLQTIRSDVARAESDHC